MRVSDLIVKFLISKKITDIFGYPGGMVTYLMESLRSNDSMIKSHLCYHEQSAAFAACAYSQVTGGCGFSYATSGPGATNLITGICNAYFDSIPVIFLTGQVNTYEMSSAKGIRQGGFQETQIVEMVQSVTKFAYQIGNAEEVLSVLNKAYNIAISGRKGPVLIDIPMNILGQEIKDNEIEILNEDIVHEITKTLIQDPQVEYFTSMVTEYLKTSKRPCILIGNGINISGCRDIFKNLARKINIPIVSSMIAVDILSRKEFSNYYGFIGAYGDRVANFVIGKCDLLISLGSRLDIRQIGKNKNEFAPNAKIIRVDIDESELNIDIRDDISLNVDLLAFLSSLISKIDIEMTDIRFKWLEVCNEIRKSLESTDDLLPNKYMKILSQNIPDDFTITTDVGQNQVWAAQSFFVKCNQRMLFSGGHGAMGYSLPASIGSYYGTQKGVICLSGDGGIQMNIQELQVIFRENLPIKIIVFNNKSLGMIRHFQELYFEKNYYHTTEKDGYEAPDFAKIAIAYGISAKRVVCVEDLYEIDFNNNKPELIEILLDYDTYVYPKLEYGKKNNDQTPLIDRELYNWIEGL